MYTVLTRLITGRCHHPALLGRAADSDRLAAVAGIVTLLHRGKKGIHIDVDDFTNCLNSLC